MKRASEHAAAHQGGQYRSGPTVMEEISDLAMAAAAVIGLALTATAIRRDVNRPAAPSIGISSPIAHVARTIGAVRRRDSNSLVWDAVGSSDALRRGDGLFVPADALLEARFEDGSSLVLEENSLVVIDLAEAHAQEPTVHLHQGGLSAAPTAHGLEVVAGGGRARIEPKALASLSVSARGDTRIDVVRGGAVLAVGANAPLALRDGSAAIDSGGAHRIQGHATLLAPPPAARSYFAASRGAVAFSWQSAAKEVVFELADDRAFTRLLASRRAGGGHVSVGDLAAGAYFWRVRAVDGTWASEARSMQLVRDLPPDPISPNRGQVLYVPGDVTASYRWSAVTGANRYFLQIATEPRFTAPLLERITDDNQLRLGAFGPEGIYYWRVRAVDAERGESPYSPAVAFRVITEPLPAAPELYDPQLEIDSQHVDPAGGPPAERPSSGSEPAPNPAPAPNAAPAPNPTPTRAPLPTRAPARTPGRKDSAPPRAAQPGGRQGWWWRYLIGVALAEEAAPKPTSETPPAAADAAEVAIMLRWSAVPGVPEYLLEIAEDQEFRHVVIRERVREPFYRWPGIAKRKHWWRVQSIDAKGRAGPFSAPRQVAAALGVPALLAPAEDTRAVIAAAVPRIELRWQAERLAAAYEVEIGSDTSFGTIVSRVNTAATTSVFTPPRSGVYAWRVRALDGQGSPGVYSAGRTLVIALGAPTPLASSPRTFVRGARLPLRVSAIATTTEYEFELAANSDFKAPVLHTRSRSPALDWVPTAPGTWWWRTRAWNGTEVSPWSRVEAARLAPDAPVVIAPSEGERLSVRSASVPLRVRWLSVCDATSYRVEVMPLGAAAPVASTVVGRSVVELSPLEGARYAITVAALAGEVASKPSAVTVERVLVPPLPAPELESPAPAARVESTERSPAVAFSWRPVEEAERYAIVLETAGASTAEHTTLLPLFVPSRMAPGEHRWHVYAVDVDGAPGTPSDTRVLYYAPPPVAPPVPSPAELRLGAAVELVTNLAASGVPAFALDGAYALEQVLPGLEITAGARYHQRRLRAAGPPASSAVQHVVPLAVGARLAVARGRLTPYVAVAGLGALFYGRVRSGGRTLLARSALGLGGEAAIGADVRQLGPGGAFLEVGYAWLRRRSGGISFDGGGLATAVGYRVEL